VITLRRVACHERSESQGLPPFALKASLSVPSFYDNFDVEQNALKNPEIQAQLQTLLDVLVG
jgi:hypothetical protein